MTYTVSELAETFAELLRGLGGALDTLGVPWMLVGGLAVGAWTEPRGTKDCDVALSVPEDASALSAALSGVGLVSLRGDLARARDGGAVRLRLDRNGAPPIAVDLLCAGTAFEHEAIARRTRCSMLGVDLPIVTPDDLVIYKLIAGRPQDLADTAKRLRVGRAPEDAARVRRWAREWGVEDRLDRSIADAARSSGV